MITNSNKFENVSFLKEMSNTMLNLKKKLTYFEEGSESVLILKIRYSYLVLVLISQALSFEKKPFSAFLLYKLKNRFLRWTVDFNGPFEHSYTFPRLPETKYW